MIGCNDTTNRKISVTERFEMHHFVSACHIIHIHIHTDIHTYTHTHTQNTHTQNTYTHTHTQNTTQPLLAKQSLDWTNDSIRLSGKNH